MPYSSSLLFICLKFLIIFFRRGPYIFIWHWTPQRYSHSWKGNLLRSFGSSLLTTKLRGLHGSLTVYCTFVAGGTFYKWFVHIFILYCFVFNPQVDTLLGYFIYLEYIWRGIYLSRTNTIRKINLSLHSFPK